jgi:protein kinase C and casein kinase substrate in neurons protein
MLRSWARRWEKRIEHGPEGVESTIRVGWNGLVDHADAVCNVHLRVAERLSTEVAADVSHWRKENYTKALLGLEYRQTRAVRLAFEAAQKPWTRLHKKVKKSREAYYRACAVLDMAARKLSDSEKAQAEAVELEKLRARVEQAKLDKDATRDAYKNWLSELQRDRPRYEQAMKEAFEKSQDMEQTRIEFFQKKMQTLHTILPRDLSESLVPLKESLDAINADADLVAYAERYGTGMPLLCPQYVEYGDKEPVLMPATLIAPRVSISNGAKYVETNTAAGYDEDWPADDIAPPDVEGVRVVALYAYRAEEDGELTFEAGDELLQVESEDEQGWCRGFNSEGQVGLFPASYVKAVDASDS